MPYNPEKQLDVVFDWKNMIIQSQAYFITSCTHNRELYFEQYPQLKQIVNLQWQKIPVRYANIQLVGATLAVAQKNGRVQDPPLQLGKSLERLNHCAYMIG